MSRLLLPRGYRNAEYLNNRLQRDPEAKWIERGQRRALKLFRAMADRVPAYKDFLKSKKFSPASVASFKDFTNIPVIDKDNYLRKYPKEMLCWDGEFSAQRFVISTTSGSTGQPFYFPRERTQDWQYAMQAELYLRNNFHIHRKTTLYIVAFPMGAWIGGLYTYEALKILSENGGYQLSIITPGIHKQEVINAVKQLGSSFDQIIIGAYAPFLKDIIDDGAREGIDWSAYDLGFIFSAEAFSETFRGYVIEKTKPTNKLMFSLNHYGTVDIGTMAHETPESIMVRRYLASADQLLLLLPESTKQPTLAQYNPELYYFEEVDNNLYCSAYSGIPLLRYNLKDYGGLMSRTDVISKLSSAGFSLNQESIKQGIEHTLWNLPYVYVYERNDFSVSYYAFLIYPDTIRRVVQSQVFSSKLTGKFTMFSEYNKQGRQKLYIHCELAHGHTSSESLVKKLTEALHKALMQESSEYAATFVSVGSEVRPDITLWPYEDPLYFKPGTKQKWTLKKE